MKNISGRMLSPDILKIFAAISVVVIHHKRSSAVHFTESYNLFYTILMCISVAVGVFLCLREGHKGGSDIKRSLLMFALPIVSAVAFYYLQWFAVCIFLIISGYLLTGSLEKHPKPFEFWYTKANIIPRILRFYIPFALIYIVGLLYKIIVLKYNYSILEIGARFILGGFKPGSYYITILAELVLIFPIIYFVVKKLKFTGVMLCTVFNLIYDLACTYLGMNDIAYKFIILRFTTHIAFGVYLRIADYNAERKRNAVLFILGLSYAVCCMYTDIYRPVIFFQWQEASFPTAFYLYPLIAWFINITKSVRYTEGKGSEWILTFANATYHIFLIQLLYYTTFGFALNEYINNVALTIPLNIIITVPIGIAYCKLISPFENRIISKVKNIL